MKKLLSASRLRREVTNLKAICSHIYFSARKFADLLQSPAACFCSPDVVTGAHTRVSHVVGCCAGILSDRVRRSSDDFYWLWSMQTCGECVHDVGDQCETVIFFFFLSAGYGGGPAAVIRSVREKILEKCRRRFVCCVAGWRCVCVCVCPADRK